MISGGHQDNAVPFWIPGRFLLTGGLALALAWTALALRPQLVLGFYGTPTALAVVHTFALGFAAMILVGAMHQLMPVLLVTRLYSTRLGTLTYLLLLAGAAAVVLGFALGYRAPLLAVGGGLTLAGLLLFGYNLLRTALKAARRDAVSVAMLLATSFLILTVILGLLIALGRIFPGITYALGYATPLHLALGLVGAFALAIAGAGHRLLAMFVLTHGVHPWRLTALLACTSAALVLLTLQAFAGLSLWLAALGLFVVAALLYFLDVAVILNKRVRKAIDLPITTYLASLAFLVLAMVLMLLGLYPSAVFSLLVGFITLAIAGMLVKIASFLSWQHRYAAHVGERRVPMLKDMIRPDLARLTLLGLGLGAAMLTAAMHWPLAPLAISGGALGALGAWGLVLHLGWIILGRHEPARQVPTSQALGGR